MGRQERHLGIGLCAGITQYIHVQNPCDRQKIAQPSTAQTTVLVGTSAAVLRTHKEGTPALRQAFREEEEETLGVPSLSTLVPHTKYGYEDVTFRVVPRGRAQENATQCKVFGSTYRPG